MTYNDGSVGHLSHDNRGFSGKNDMEVVDVHVIIVNWNNFNDTIAAVESVLRGRLLPHKIIIIDNDSDNGSFDILKQHFRNTELTEILCISSSRNLGFGGANNLALRYITLNNNGYTWLLNPDTVVTTNTLSSLVEKMDSNGNCGAVGSKIINYQNREIQTLGGGSLNWFTGATGNIVSESKTSKLVFITAASMLLRNEVLKEIKFDEEFFLYWEDVDLSLRIKNSGWILCYCDDSIVYHKESTSLGKRTSLMDFYFTKSSIIFYKKHTKFYIIPAIISITRRLVHRLATGKLKNIGSILRAIKNDAR